MERDRSKIPVEHTWDLTHLYPDAGTWRSAREAFRAEIPLLDRYRGRLASSPAVLLECLELLSRLGKEFARLSCYASMLSDLDTRSAAHLAMDQEMGQIGADVAARSSFVEPEILGMDASMIEEFIAREPGLASHRHSLEDTLRRKIHTGTEREEKILADSGLIADAPGGIYGIFSNADFPFPEVTLADGDTLKLDKAAFALARASGNRDDRRTVFAAFFGKLGQFRRTFGTQLYAEVKKNMFYARARNYPTALDRALDGGNIPRGVYRGLIDNVRAHLPTFHRSLDLRRRILGLDRLHYYDLYAPLTRTPDREFTIDDAKQLVLDSLAPLGADYRAVAARCFAERWVDVFPNDGKRSGAYSNGAAYDVHPYILLNYNGRYDDVSTLAHELGHTMHSHLANGAQPYHNAHYSIFVAEVASTFNEALLLEWMLRTIVDRGERLALLGHFLDGVRGTIFRQTLFAEFELGIHESAERGESLTGDSLSELYGRLTREYYGHDAGVCTVGEEIDAEWAYIPHFYYDFYVYQYATSFTASAALSEQVLAEEPGARERYLGLLRAGGSDYPIELMRRAGVDMTTSAPFERTMQKLNRVMDEMEKLMSLGGTSSD